MQKAHFREVILQVQFNPRILLLSPSSKGAGKSETLFVFSSNRYLQSNPSQTVALNILLLEIIYMAILDHDRPSAELEELCKKSSELRYTTYKKAQRKKKIFLVKLKLMNLIYMSNLRTSTDVEFNVRGEV